MLRFLLSGLLLSSLLGLPASAHGACAPMRVAYLDQDRPPYWLGDGEQVPEPPGVGVEFLRAAAAGLKCPLVLVRLPVLRVASALQSGEIDFAPIEERSGYPSGYVFPRDKDGALDRDRSIQTSAIVFVRAADHLPAELNPQRYFQGRLLGTTLGAAYGAALREAGFGIDDGARDLARNVDKLRLRRVDGVVLTLAQPGDMDAVLAARYGDEVVRLRTPLASNRVWLATNPQYYRAHREQVEALWNWIGSNRGKLGGLLEKYARAGN